LAEQANVDGDLQAEPVNFLKAFVSRADFPDQEFTTTAMDFLEGNLSKRKDRLDMLEAYIKEWSVAALTNSTYIKNRWPDPPALTRW